MSVSRRTVIVVAALSLVALLGAALPRHAAAATVTWSGAGSDQNWSTGANWVGGTAPSSGDSLVFPAGGAVNHLSNNDLVGFTAASIDIQDSGYGITGNALTSGPISMTAGAGPSAFNLSVTFAAPETVTVASGSTLAFDGALAGGANALTLDGPGRVDLNVADTYSGGTAIGNSAVVAVADSTALGTGAVTLADGTVLDLVSAGVNVANSVSVGVATIASTVFSAQISGPISMTGASSPVFTASPNTQLNLTGNISGAVGPTFLGSGTPPASVRLSGTNSWAGPSSVGNPGASDVDVVAFAPASLSTTAVTIASGASLNLDATAAAQTWTNAFTVAGNGGTAGAALEATGFASTVSGAVSIDPAGATLGDGTNGVTLTGALSGSGQLELTGLGAYTVAGTGGNTDSGAVTVTNTGGAILGETAGVALDAAAISVTSSSQVRLLAAGQLNPSADVTLNGAAVLDLNGQTQTLAQLIFNGGGGSVTDGTLTVTSALTTQLTSSPVTLGSTVGGGSFTFGGATITVNSGGASPADLIVNMVPHIGSATITGGGITRVMANGMDGAPTLAAGTLLMEGSTTFGATIDVHSSATLGGNGTFFFPTIESGGFLSPGDSPGILGTFTFNLKPGSTFVAEVNGTTAGTQYDQTSYAPGGTVTGANLDFRLGYAPTPGDSYSLITTIGPNSVVGTFAGLPEGAVFVAGFGGNSYAFRITYDGGAGHDVVVTALAPVTTSVGLTASPNPASTGQSVTLTASVSATGLTVNSGTVTFFDGTTSLGTVAVNSSGVATLATSFSATGTHDLTAHFNGTTAFATATSGVLAENVRAAASVPVPTTGAGGADIRLLAAAALLLLGAVALRRWRFSLRS